MTKDEIIENLNLVIEKQSEELQDLTRTQRIIRERGEILMRLYGATEEVLTTYAQLLNNYTVAHQDDVVSLSKKLDNVEARAVELASRLQKTMEERDSALNSLLDRQVTIGQLKDQVEALRDRVIDANRRAAAAQPETVI
jgi:uncharacterized protein (DUF3084 family)